jgi:hypothetical protein
LAWVQETFGMGYIYDRPVRASRPKAAASFEWKVGKRAEIRMLCELMYPYLKVKGPQVEIMLSYIDGETVAERSVEDCKWWKTQHC